MARSGHRDQRHKVSPSALFPTAEAFVCRGKSTRSVRCIDGYAGTGNPGDARAELLIRCLFFIAEKDVTVIDDAVYR
jgi:hypothetical protein